MQERQIQLITLNEMTPNVNRKPGIESKSVNLVTTRTKTPPEIEEKSVDLISVTSEDYKDDDQISFDENRLQQWNTSEFYMQLWGAAAGIILLFSCGTLSAWAVTDFVKDVQVHKAAWIDIDYSFELFDDEEREFLSSRHVIIAMVVLSFNIGCIIGGIFGAFITPILPNRAIYTLGSVCMLFTGITLTKHTSPFYCAKSRLVAGLIYGLIQLTIIVQAAETTTKKCRRWILIVVAYLSATSNLISTIIFYYYDDRVEITYSEQNPALYIVSYVLIGCSVIALIVNFICTTDTVPFYLNRGEDTKAFKELTRLKVNHLSMLDIRYEYERIRFDVAQCQLDINRNLAAKNNHVPLLSMCCVRILNLLFTSVPMTLVLIWDPSSTEESDENNFEYITSLNSTISPSIDENENKYISPLVTLAVLQAFRLLCSIGVIWRQDKYHFNRFSYKMAGFTGIFLIIWFVARVVLGSIETIQNVLFFPVSIVIMMGFIGLPLPLDVIQLSQSADSYARIKNSWALACAIFIENIVHIFLVVQLDMIFGVMFVFLVNGVTMIFFSYWLLKNMPNVVAIHPITVAFVARYPFKNASNDQTHTIYI
ncbi:uncharacterized protein LOC116341345 [Contarinia nasturtii]|uniref:uncharacterized protein LOC116341345 n=1 Tax=Contarinia nasturtii TaxID=265458 RepID=UPI0012D410F0|nr:uncharacterized protein LOC116341345 [Contarinia nasturtii]